MPNGNVLKFLIRDGAIALSEGQISPEQFKGFYETLNRLEEIQLPKTPVAVKKKGGRPKKQESTNPRLPQPNIEQTQTVAAMTSVKPKTEKKADLI